MNLTITTITNIPAISAIYYALLQGGYEYYPLDRDHAHADVIQSFAHGSRALPFFDGARQHSCDVYAYWPRAALFRDCLAASSAIQCRHGLDGSKKETIQDALKFFW